MVQKLDYNITTLFSITQIIVVIILNFSKIQEACEDAVEVTADTYSMYPATYYFDPINTPKMMINVSIMK